MSEIVVEARDVSFSYKNNGTMTNQVLNSVDFTARSGELVALVGPSGSGKSSILNILGGLQPPDGGTVMVAGEQMYSMTDSALSAWRARSIGFIFQAFHLISSLTVLQNIQLPRSLAGFKDAHSDDLTDHLASRLGIADILRKKPHQLSGGQQQRVAIARALINEPSIILADEPTGNLDRENSDKVMHLLTECVKDGMASSLVVVTHDQHVLHHMTTVAEMVDGKLRSTQKDAV